MRQKLIAVALSAIVLWGLVLACHSRGDDLNDAYALAEKNGKPVVVFVNVDIRKVPGAVSVQVDEYAGSNEPRILIARWNARYLDRLPATAMDADLQAAIAPKGGRPVAAVPFEQTATADDEEAAQLVPMIAELEPYQRATMTQQSFRRWSGVISPFPRSRTLAKWRSPGGLEGVHGWSSRLYRTKGMRVRAFLTRQDPSDGNSAVTWWQNYPDGSTFADVLRNDAGVVFEVRIAEKSSGEWERFIAYKKASARPEGYSPLKRSDCRSCHLSAGIAEYGGTANPGADGIFSHPIEPLENMRTVQGGSDTSL